MSQIAAGIYLETKQSKLGTGHTSSNVVFRTFWAGLGPPASRWRSTCSTTSWRPPAWLS